MVLLSQLLCHLIVEGVLKEFVQHTAFSTNRCARPFCFTGVWGVTRTSFRPPLSQRRIPCLHRQVDVRGPAPLGGLACKARGHAPGWCDGGVT